MNLAIAEDDDFLLGAPFSHRNLNRSAHMAGVRIFNEQLLIEVFAVYSILSEVLFGERLAGQNVINALLRDISVFGEGVASMLAFRFTISHALGAEDMAKAIGRAIGRSVKAVPTPVWLFMKAARLFGMPIDTASNIRYYHRRSQARRLRTGRANDRRARCDRSTP